MDKLLTDALAERVESLERENRRWRWAVGFALLASLVIMAGGAYRADEKVVEAERFIVRDKDGKVRLWMGMNPSGTPSLTLFDKDQKSRLMMILAPDGKPEIVLRDESGRGGVGIGSTRDGAMVLSISDKDGRAYVSLSLAPDGKSALTFRKQGETRLEIAVSPDGTPLLEGIKP
jgi:hypothetical protein